MPMPQPPPVPAAGADPTGTGAAIAARADSAAEIKNVRWCGVREKRVTSRLSPHSTPGPAHRDKAADPEGTPTGHSSRHRDGWTDPRCHAPTITSRGGIGIMSPDSGLSSDGFLIQFSRNFSIGDN